jgi:hypothetical protein
VLTLISHLGGDDNVEESKAFIKDKYFSMIPTINHQMVKTVYAHFTCSVGRSENLSFEQGLTVSLSSDSKNIRIVFESVRDTIMAINLSQWSPY